MSKALITESLLTNISKAIDSTDKTPAQMATALQTAIASANTTTGESDTTIVDALQSLSSGYGGGITGDDINTVSVSSTTVNRQFLSGDIVLTGTKIFAAAFIGTAITSVYGENITDIQGFYSGGGWNKSYCFTGCSELISASFPKLTTVGGNFLEMCTKLTTVNLPSLVTAGTGLCGRCSSLRVCALPAITGTLDRLFQLCSLLEAVDLGNPTQINANMFQNDAKLNTLILRTSSATCALANINAFNGTPFASGGAGGTIYVPSALIDSYKTATNWSTLDGYGTVTWAAIEGSQYENYYADGTAVTS